jgi:hypothetical protein
LSPPDYVLNRHGSRVLDPTSAVRLKNQKRIRPTVYVGARLLLRGYDVSDGTVPEALQGAARDAGLEASVYPPDIELAQEAKRSGVAELAARVLVARIDLTPISDGPTPPADAWQVLQNYRVRDDVTADEVKNLSLDHLTTATADIQGAPLWSGVGIEGVPLWSGVGMDGAPLWSGVGIAGPSRDFGLPGRGARMPVAWQGLPPDRRDREELPSRRPVVAILDTGVGKHPWLNWPVVWRHPRIGTLPIGLTDLSTDAEITGKVGDPLEGTLDPDAGHGTFIAGLIHQKCPEAKIISVRVMHGDGAVAEGDILEALNRLLLRHAAAFAKNDKRALLTSSPFLSATTTSSRPTRTSTHCYWCRSASWASSASSSWLRLVMTPRLGTCTRPGSRTSPRPARGPRRGSSCQPRRTQPGRQDGRAVQQPG